MNDVKVSICMPTLNARAFLVERMDSILNQTETDWELIVCDSYSDDGTWEYLQTFVADSRVKLFRVPKAGLYAGWNECLRKAKGDFIYIATADDTMRPDCLYTLAVPLTADSSISLAIGHVEQIDAAGLPMSAVKRGIHQFLSTWQELPAIRLTGPAVFLLLAAFDWGLGSVTGFMFRRSLLDKVGYFPTDLGFLGDAEWTLRAVLTGDIVWLNQIVATWRWHPTQASRQKNKLLEAWCFREALRRVLDDPSSGIPDAWRKDDHLRLALLQPRTDQLEMATRLHRSTLGSHLCEWPKWISYAWRLDPTLVFQRLKYLFGTPPTWEVKPKDRFIEWLATFEAEWPPVSFFVNRQFEIESR
jgi:glycosyltransferase involved in cell wall biosynthesis